MNFDSTTQQCKWFFILQRFVVVFECWPNRTVRKGPLVSNAPMPIFASPAGVRSMTTPLMSAWCVTAVCADATKSLKNKVSRSSSRVDVCFEETEVLLSLTSWSLASPLRQTAICWSAVRSVWTTGYFFLSRVGDDFPLCRLEVFQWLPMWQPGRFGTLKIKTRITSLTFLKLWCVCLAFPGPFCLSVWWHGPETGQIETLWYQIKLSLQHAAMVAENTFKE